MSRWGSVDFRQFTELRDKINTLQQTDFERFSVDAVKELAARTLRAVVRITPVGINTYEDILDNDGVVKTYQRGKRKGIIKERVIKNGGTLRRGWTVGNVNHYDGYYVIEVFNQVLYASYVEFGHRQTPGRYVAAIGKKLKKSWVPGKFMLTITEKEIQRDAQGIIERKLIRFLTKEFDS